MQPAPGQQYMLVLAVRQGHETLVARGMWTARQEIDVELVGQLEPPIAVVALHPVDVAVVVAVVVVGGAAAGSSASWAVRHGAVTLPSSQFVVPLAAF